MPETNDSQKHIINVTVRNKRAYDDGAFYCSANQAWNYTSGARLCYRPL